MDGDSSWSARLSSASRHYQSALQSQSDMFMGFDENDCDDDIREEFLCPFCSEYFDIAGLCCHIDEEHPMEAKNGVCPVCALRVGTDMVAHITLQHGSIFKLLIPLPHFWAPLDIWTECNGFASAVPSELESVLRLKTVDYFVTRRPWLGVWRDRMWPDGWTAVTADGKRSAQFEDTLLLTAVILGHVWCSQHPQMRGRIEQLLKQNKLSKKHVKDILQEYHDNIGDLDGPEEKERAQTKIQKFIIAL